MKPQYLTNNQWMHCPWSISEFIFKDNVEDIQLKTLIKHVLIRPVLWRRSLSVSFNMVIMH